jgi:hypothetical protein
VAAAFALGLYGAGSLSLSVLAVVPGLVGVTLGGIGRTRVPDRYLTGGTFLLLGVVGIRLTATGMGV